MAFCLKVRSDYSFLSSTIRIDDMISFCTKNNIKQASLIDTNLFGALTFYNACISNNIKPIIGIELNVRFSDVVFPIIFIAKSELGYKNISKLSSLTNKYQQTSIDFKILSMYAQDVALVLSSEDSYLTHLISNNQIFEANEFIDAIKDSFKEYYLGIFRYKNINANLINLLKEYATQANIKCIAMQIATHKNNKDTVILNLLNCIEQNIAANKEYLNNPSICEAYLKTPDELKVYYDKDELDNLVSFANSVSIKINKVDFSLPVIYENSDRKLEELAFAKLNELNLSENQKYLDRTRYELSIVTKMGFSNYYLVVADYVNYAKNHDIPVGPSRGSGAASLLAYLLNITTVDPLKYDLLFERFLNPSRSNYPDFDIDFADIKRDEIINYVKDKYGYKKVAHIATFATFGPKSAIRDVARLMKTSNDDVDYLMKAMSSNPKSINDEYKNNKKFKDLLDIHPNYKTICSLASNMEGLKRQVGLHAAGMILSNDNLEELVPTFECAENTISIQYDYVLAEKMGLIKMDFLGLKNLTIIDYCIKKINKLYNKSYTIENFPFDEESSYNQISSMQTLGLFQLESDGMNKVIGKLKPSCFDDIVALLALYRPGPMDSIETYIDRKFNGNYSIDSAIEDILKPTYGIIIYQEQIMQICQKVASYTLGDADILRRAISKKNLFLIKEEKDKFVKRCMANNYSYAKASELFALIEKFASYGFNKAHSVGYSIIATMMAYIKANYKTIFYDALLNINQESGERKKKLFEEAKKNNIRILKPCIITSDVSFTTTNDSIQFGLTNIASIKENIALTIINERNKAPFNDIYDFLIRMVLNDVSMQVILDLTYAGALDCFNISKEKIVANLNNLYSYALMFKGLDYKPNTYENYLAIGKPIMFYEDEETDFIKKEFEMLGLYLSIHPLTKIKEKYSKKVTLISEIENDGYYDILGKITLIDIRKTKDNKDSLYLKVEDESSTITIREYKDALNYKNTYKKGQIVCANVTYKNGYYYLNKMEKVEV